MGRLLSDRCRQTGGMILNRKQFLAALSILTSFPAWLRAFTFRGGAGGGGHPSATAGPMRDGPWLADWRQARRVKVRESVHPVAQRLILAASRHELMVLRYWGGSTPGRERYISPLVVFQLDGSGSLYLSAFCHLRRAERVFNLGRMELLAEEDGIICITE